MNTFFTDRRTPVGMATDARPRTRGRTPLLPLLATGLLLFVAPSCKSDDSPQDQTAPPAGSAEFKAAITADRHTGAVTDTFNLGVVLDNTLEGPLDYTWSLGPLGTQTGATVAATFPDPGTIPISVEVTEATGLGRSSTASTLLFVVDPGSPGGIFNDPLVQFPGDLNGDGLLTLADGLLQSQHLSGLERFQTRDELRTADFDRDGSVTDTDLDLLSRAVIEQSVVPRAVNPNQARPGQVIQVFSPELLDLTRLLQVQIGNTPAFEPIRVAPGQINFFVPLDVLTPGVYTANGGTTTVDLLENGVVVESLELFVLDAIAPPSDPLAEIDTLLTDIASLRNNLLTDLDAFFATPEAALLGYTPQDGTVLCTIFEQASDKLAELETELRPALQGLGRSEQEFVARIAYANGLGDAAEALQGLRQTRGTVLGQSTIFLLCQIENSAAQLERANQYAGYVCAGLGALFVASLGVGVIFPGAFVISGPALTAFQGCATGLAAAELTQVVLDFVPDVSDQLLLEAIGSTTAAPGETITIEPKVQLTGLDSLCSLLANGGSDELFEELLAEPLTEILLRKYPLRPVYDLVRRISPAAADELEEVIEDILISLLNTTPVTGYLGDLAGRLCVQLGVSFPVDPALIVLEATPAVGTIGVTATGLTFTCPPATTPLNGPITLRGTLVLCDGEAVGTIQVSCGEEIQVTITMGDNGSLLDDIFEVVIDGQSVLTSSIPVTSVSTTLPLTTGLHSLQMNGLAAPDGVGTYFISVTNGILTNGPSLSGSDLVAGATFSWDLEVQ